MFQGAEMGQGADSASGGYVLQQPGDEHSTTKVEFNAYAWRQLAPSVP
jgi:hypothetical protein